MITRLYVDNFRCLEAFEWEPGSEVLMLGYNGSGKTSILDAIDLIRSWCSGWDRLEDLLPVEALTRWRNSGRVTLGLNMSSEGEEFRYRIEVERQPSYAFVQSEFLSNGSRKVFERSASVVFVSNGEASPVAQFSLPLNQSAIPAIAASDHGKYSSEFLALLAKMIVVRPMPPLMEPTSRKPEPRASFRFENFVAWFQYWAVQGKFSAAWLGLLKDIWEDFDYMEFEKLGRDETGLNIVFSRAELATGKLKLEFQELSEGQRMLIVLYALLAYQKAVPATTIIIDEPDNFVALSELQPWLLRMLDERSRDGQIILVSHNSEIISTMGIESVAYISRIDHLSPTSISGLSDDDSGLGPGDRLKLGWIEPAGDSLDAAKN